jgi:hypothetical protein
VPGSAPGISSLDAQQPTEKPGARFQYLQMCAGDKQAYKWYLTHYHTIIVTIIIKIADSADTVMNSRNKELCKGLLSCIYSIM